MSTNPFPGMNPYLEAPDLWPSFHTMFITQIAEKLNHILPDEFAARVEQRCYIAWEDRQIVPDTLVVDERDSWQPSSSQGRVAVADRTVESTPEVLQLVSWQVRERYLEIRQVRGNKRVVTAIELLSPTNKRSGEGRDQYLHKQREVLSSDVNLLEIDLLRSGSHTIAAPADVIRRRFGDWTYLIILNRCRDRKRIELWRNHLPERLPGVRVPLSDDFPDVILDLQAVFDHAYDAGRYNNEMNYQQDAEPPLQGDDAAWADALLKEKGLRSG